MTMSVQKAFSMLAVPSTLQFEYHPQYGQSKQKLNS